MCLSSCRTLKQAHLNLSWMVKVLAAARGQIQPPVHEDGSLKGQRRRRIQKQGFIGFAILPQVNRR